MSPDLLLLLLLGGDGWVEASAWARQDDTVAPWGAQVVAMAAPEPGATLLGTVSLRNSPETRFAATPYAGVMATDDPYPDDDTRWNAVVGLRLELDMDDLVLVVEGRHISNGRAALGHDHHNPGSDVLMIGIGWRP